LLNGQNKSKIASNGRLLLKKRRLNWSCSAEEEEEEEAPRPRRPETVTTPKIIDQIHELILEDPRPNFG
jgi:hypothetical protein